MPGVIGLAVLAWAQHEARHRGAEDSARHAVELAVRYPHVHHRTDAFRTLGMVLRETGRWGEADRVLYGAVSLARSIAYPFGEARALFEWARLDLAQGETDRGRARFAEALAIFRGLAAKPYIELTERSVAGLDDS